MLIIHLISLDILDDTVTLVCSVFLLVDVHQHLILVLESFWILIQVLLSISDILDIFVALTQDSLKIILYFIFIEIETVFSFMKPTVAGGQIGLL